MIPVALVVSLLVTNLQLTSYKDRRGVFEEQQRQSQERLNNIYFYSQLKMDVYMPPSLLSVFAKGLDESIGNKITVSAFDLPELTTTAQRGNAFIRLFNSIDVTGVVRILSIFIVLMAACPIAQEREQQTGKIIFANSILRLEYYLSKYVALMAIGGIVTLVTFVTPIVRMWFDTQVGLSPSDIGSIALMMLSGILYLSVFVLISLAISAASPKISVATLASLMVWVMLTYVYPFTANSVIDRLVKVPSDNSVTEEIEKISLEIWKEGRSFIEAHNYHIFNSNYGMSTGNFNLIAENRGTTKKTFEATKAVHDHMFPKIWDRMKEMERIRNEQKAKQLYKKLLYDKVSFVIPDRMYQQLCESVASTDYASREKRITDGARNYRSILMSYIQSAGGFGYPFFTQMPVSEMRDNWKDYPQEVIDRYCKKPESLNISGVPQWVMPRKAADFSAWVTLLLFNLVAGCLSIWIFNKYLSFK
jgi:ABC-type transport system involved in multi-copper enzyme maturation permease subunit